MILKKHLLSILCVATFLVIAVASGSDVDETKTNASNETTKGQEQPKSKWSYSEKEDKMSGTKQFFATTVSTNKVKFKFPYDGGSEFYLIVRNLGKKNELLFQVSKGQIMPSILNSEHCRIKFDDGEPMDVNYSMPADASSDLIFLDKSTQLIQNLKTAKKVMIEVPYYDEGRQIAEFDVEGLEWAK